jgi:hypothetical protein
VGSLVAKDSRPEIGHRPPGLVPTSALAAPRTHHPLRWLDDVAGVVWAQKMAAMILSLSLLKGHTMTAKLAGTQVWQKNLASLIRSGFFSRAGTGQANGLFTVVGVYMDETCSAPLAKYSDRRRAADCANLVNRIALLRGPVESN